MKTKFYLLMVFLFCLGNLGYSQTGIGAYSVHDGGFENQTVGNVPGGSASAVALSSTSWSASTTSSAAITRAILSTGGRSGSQCASFGSLSTTTKSFYTPQISGAFAANTKYQIQFWYKPTTTTATLSSSSVDLYVDNASATAAPASIGTKQTVSAGLDKTKTDWTKVAVEITTNATAAGSFGLAAISFTTAAASTNFTASFDDFVIYQANAADTSAPNSPGTVTATGASSSTATVSWGAASGGVDGGGYVVVRYATTAPSASDDPLQNGIYKFASTVGAGVVRYIGSSTSFTDTSLSAGVDYYYKVYTVDKAFNYSNETATSSPVQALATTYYYDGTGALTDFTNWGTNTNGSGTIPVNFTDVAQVFEIRNTTAVTLDGSWTVGTDPTNGTKVRLGNTDQAAITLTLNSGASILPAGTGNLDVMTPSSGKQTVIYQGTTAISFGNIFDSNLEVIYDGVTISSTTTKSFGTITIKNGANVTFTATPIIKNISVDASSTLIAPTNASSYITIPSGGAVTINGTVKVPKLTGFVSSNVGTSGSTFGDFQFIGTENLTLGSNSIVEYARDATGVQSVTARADYKNVTLSGTCPKSFAGITSISGTLTINQTGSSLVTLAADTTVNGTLLFTNGKIDTGTNALILGASATISGAGTSSGWVIGNLRKTTSAGASPSFTYTIGDANYYTPLALTFSNNTSATGTLTAKTTSGDHAQIATSGITASNSINRTWTLTNSNLAGLSSYNATLTYATQDNDSGALPQFFAARLYNGASWANLTTSGTPTSTSFTAASITTFGDFAIGQVCINPTSGGTIAGAQSLCSPANPAAFTNSVSASGNVGTLEYQWQSSTNNINFSDIAGATASTYDAPSGLTATTYYKRLSRVDCKSDWTGAAESNVVTVTVITTAAPSASAQTFCNAGTVADLDAAGTDLNWYLASTGGSALSSSTAISTRTYYVSQTLNGCESTRTSVSVTVNVTAAPTASAQSFCNAAMVSDLVATGTSLKWYDVATSGTALTGSTAIDSGTYYVSQTLNSCEGARRSVVVTINSNPTSGGTIAGTQSLCSPGNPAAFTSSASASGQIGSLEYQWQSSNNNIDFTDIAGATSSTYDAPSGLTTTTYYKRLARVSCKSDWTGAAESNVITVTINPVLTPTFTQVNPICFGGTLSALPTTSTNSISGSWSPAINSAATTLYTFTPSDQCSLSATMTIVVKRSLAGTTSANQTVTWGAQPDDITLTNSSGSVQWQSSTNNSSFTNIAGAPNSPTLDGAFIGALTANRYFRAIVNDGGCGNVTSGTVSVTIITTTNIKSSQCGSTLNTMDSQILADIYPTAQMYRFQVTNGATVRTYDTPNFNFDLTKVAGSTYATTYAVKVAVKVNNTWGAYGTACNITTPTVVSANNVPLTKMRASQCGTTLATIGSPIHSELVYGAEAYRFQITNGATVNVVETTNYYFLLTNTTFGTYGTTFSVKTAAKVAGTWGNYGTPCSISTPVLTASSVPTTQLISTFCNATLAALSTKIGANPVYNADAYRFKIVKGGVETIYVSSAYNFKLSDAGIVPTNGTTYAISVAARVSGTFGNYGASCNVTTPGGAGNSRQIVENTDFSLVAYPNPSNSVFKLQINGANNETVSILVFDMMGRQIENKVVNASDVENISLGQNYSTGVYNVIVSQGMNTKTVRLVKN